jgi:outer membrane protein
MTQTRTPFRPVALLGAAVLATLAAAPAFAQDDGPRGWTVTVGAGAQTYARYPGADSYTIRPLILFDLRHQGEDRSFGALDDGVGFGVLGHDSMFNFGPAVRAQDKRREEDVGAAVGDVSRTFEAGGFVEFYPIRSLRLRAELRQGLGGHDGLVGHLGADFIVRDQSTYIFSIGPRVRWADNDYHDAYFGVTPAVATATGLAAFNPHSGIYAVGGQANFFYKIGRNWGMQGYAGYDRMVRDAADSPITRAFGSRDNFSGGAGLFFEFNVGGHRH